MGKHYATLKDVASLAGTTAATVSYVLNDAKDRYVSEEMRERVLKAAKELNYVKSSVASSLKGQKRKMIAVLVPQFANQFFTRMVLAVEQVADEYDYILTICNTFDDPKREQVIINRMAQHRVDGYIIIPTQEGAKNTEQLRQMGVPMVVLDRPLQGAQDYIWVTTSNYNCGYQGTKHLIEKGHEHIAYVGWNTGIHDLEIRETAFWDALEEAGVASEKAAAVNGEFTMEAGYHLTKSLMEARPDITAFFYAYNIQARGGVQYLTEQNIEIGKDVSVVLIGSPEWAVSGRNNFTHIVQYEYDMGKKAAEALFAVITGKDSGTKRNIIQDCSVYEGDSVCNIKKT